MLTSHGYCGIEQVGTGRVLAGHGAVSDQQRVNGSIVGEGWSSLLMVSPVKIVQLRESRASMVWKPILLS